MDIFLQKGWTPYTLYCNMVTLSSKRTLSWSHAHLKIHRAPYAIEMV